MAKVTNAFDTYTAKGIREDLSDVIYNISPEETPFVSAIGKRSISNTKFEWQTEALPTVATTAQLEGETVATAAPTNTARCSNQCQILIRSAAVTGTQAAMNRAGVSDAMAQGILDAFGGSGASLNNDPISFTCKPKPSVSLKNDEYFGR